MFNALEQIKRIETAFDEGPAAPANCSEELPVQLRFESSLNETAFLRNNMFGRLLRPYLHECLRKKHYNTKQARNKLKRIQ